MAADFAMNDQFVAQVRGKLLRPLLLPEESKGSSSAASGDGAGIIDPDEFAAKFDDVVEAVNRIPLAAGLSGGAGGAEDGNARRAPGFDWRLFSKSPASALC